MPTRRCCCTIPACLLGDDMFNRADANPPTGNWKEISGEFEILSNTLNSITPGKLATTICHPAIYNHGSWIANMTLVDCRTRTIFSVGAGDPNSSTLKVTFEPIDMDTPNAKIRTTVYADEEVYFDFPWTGSENNVDVQVCYFPTVKLSGFVLGAGTPVDACLAADGSPCYSSGGDDVGGFFFIEGRFDDWEYEVSAMDNIDCPNCGCFCFRPTSDLEPDVACIPQILNAHFEPVVGSECELPAFDVRLYKISTSAVQWASGPLTLCGWPWELKANCSCGVRPNGKPYCTLSLQIFATGAPETFSLYWANLNNPDAQGDTINIKFPQYEESTCKPLSLVYKYATIYNTASSGGSGGGSSWYNICCGYWEGINTTLLWEVTVTEV